MAFPINAKCDKEKNIHIFGTPEPKCQCGEYQKLSSIIEEEVLKELDKPFVCDNPLWKGKTNV